MAVLVDAFNKETFSGHCEISFAKRAFKNVLYTCEIGMVVQKIIADGR